MSADMGHRLIAAYGRRRPFEAAIITYCFLFTGFTFMADSCAALGRPLKTSELRYVLPLSFALVTFINFSRQKRRFV